MSAIGELEYALNRATALIREAVRADERRIVVALSGGADSACLARAAASADVQCVCVHVNHHLRPDAHHDERAARACAATLGLPFMVAHIRADAIRAHAGGVEAGARALRYRALHRVANGDPVLTGHTADDRLETLILRIAQGVGLGGLSGPRAHATARHGPTIRPLLHMWRDQTRRIATANELPWVDDPSNEDHRFLRNRIRATVTPEVLAMGSRASVLRSLDTISNDADAFRALAAWVAADLEIDNTPGAHVHHAALPPAMPSVTPEEAPHGTPHGTSDASPASTTWTASRRALLAFPAVARRAILRAALETIPGARPTYDLIARVSTAVEGAHDGQTVDGPGVRAVIGGDRVTIRAARGSARERDACDHWREVAMHDGPVAMVTSSIEIPLNGPPYRRVYRHGGLTIEIELGAPGSVPPKPTRARHIFAVDHERGPWAIRPATENDTYIPHGARRSVRAIATVPLDRRALPLVLAAEGSILASLCGRRGSDALVGPSTCRWLSVGAWPVAAPRCS